MTGRQEEIPALKNTASGIVKSMRSVGLFFCIGKQEELSFVHQFIERVSSELGAVSVLVLYLGKSKVDQQDDGIIWIDKKAFNLFGKMKPQLKKKLKEHTFDLFISFVKPDTKMSAQVITRTQAPLKIGPKRVTGKQIVDFSLAVPGGEMNYDEFYGQLKFYMEKLNIKIQ